MDIRPLAGALGAEIHGVALATLEDEHAWRQIHRAFLDHAVLVFRDQALAPADLMRVGERFGPPCHYPFVTGIEGYPYIFEVVKEEAETTNFGGSWHSDTTYLREPPLATLLYAIETPAHGGDTLFASTSAAYEALSPAMRDLLGGIVGVNSAALKYGGGRSKMHSKIGGMKVHDTDEAEQYESEHPVVRTHPDTGRKALFVSRSHTIRFKDMTEAESAPLLEYLYEHAARPEFTCRFRWRPGSIAFWDNRCVQHNAINDYHGQRRVMHRVTIEGERPV